MKYLLILVVLLAGCKDRYRYFCQNPDNFGAPQCQKPACEFTQTCPEYLVAPILGEKIVQGSSTQVAGQPAQQAASNCR